MNWQTEPWIQINHVLVAVVVLAIAAILAGYYRKARSIGIQRSFGLLVIGMVTIAAFHLIELLLPSGNTWHLMHDVMNVLGYALMAAAAWSVGLGIKRIVRAEAALRTSEGRFRDYSRAAGDWFWESDRDHRFTFVSSRIKELTGIEPADLVGRSRRQLACDDGESAQWVKHLDDMEHHRPFRDFCYWGLDGHGAKRCYKVNGTPTFDQHGEFTGYRGTAVDFTTETKVEQRAQAAESRLVAAIEAMDDAIALFDSEDCLVLCNESYRRRLFNPDPQLFASRPTFEELARKAITKETLPEGEKDVESWLARRIARHRDPRGPFETHVRDRWFQFIENRTPDGGTILIIRDITALKVRELALRESENRFRHFAEAASDWFWELDENLRYPYISGGFQEITGVSPQESLGKTRREIAERRGEFARDDSYVQRLENQLTCLESHVPFRDFRYCIVTDDGDPRHISSSGMPIFDMDGSFKGYRGASRDITEQKLAEEAVGRLNEELEQRVTDRTAELEASNRELESFSYSVSHDLRAPLRHIVGFVQLLEEEMGDEFHAQHRHYLDTISRSAARMAELIDNLLKFSRMGRAEMSRSLVNLNDLVAEIIDTLDSHASNRHIAWSMQELPWVRGDAQLLRLVITNLLENAVKFTRTRDDARIVVGCGPEVDNEHVVYVSDNGVGFDDKYVGKMFGVFQQLHNPSEFEGTGIGLAIVKRLVQRHGGRAWAESCEGQGATFYFSLPIPDWGQASSS